MIQDVPDLDALEPHFRGYMILNNHISKTSYLGCLNRM
jgi:hypothetical protein